MAAKPNQATVPEPVETLRTLFKRAHDDLNMNTSQISAMLKDELGIIWPYRELRRFVFAQTRNTRRPLQQIQDMTGAMRKLFMEAGLTPVFLLVPLTPEQKTAIDVGLIDRDRLIAVMQDDMRKQLMAIATAKPDMP